MAEQADFPIGFAETVKDDNSNIELYVEWLRNNEEFPDLLSTKRTIKDNAWEVLEAKEINKENFALVPEDDDWSKINAFDTFSYLDVAEKNADELKPTKRTVQPLWPNQGRVEKKDSNDKDEDDEQFDATTIYESHKSQRKLAIRTNHLNKLEILRTFDILVPGMYEMGTLKTGQVFCPDEEGVDVNRNFKSKRQALVTASCMNNGYRKWPQPTDRVIKNKRSKIDFKQYNVFDNCEKRDQNIIND